MPNGFKRRQITRFRRRRKDPTLPESPSITIQPALTTKKRNNGNGNGKLSVNQKIFANEWLIDRNGTRAYKVAYPTVKNDEVAASCASSLLRKIKVEAYVNARLEIIKDKAEIDQEWVLERYKRLIEYDLDDFYDDEGNLKPLSEIPKDAKYAVCGFKNAKHSEVIEYKIGTVKTIKSLLQRLKMSDKKEVLDSIGKYLGMFEKDNEQKRPLIPVQINVGLTD